MTKPPQPIRCDVNKFMYMYVIQSSLRVTFPLLKLASGGASLLQTNVTKKKAKGKVAVRLERNDDIFGADSVNNIGDYDDDGDFM